MTFLRRVERSTGRFLKDSKSTSHRQFILFTPSTYWARYANALTNTPRERRTALASIDAHTRNSIEGLKYTVTKLQFFNVTLANHRVIHSTRGIKFPGNLSAINQRISIYSQKYTQRFVIRVFALRFTFRSILPGAAFMKAATESLQKKAQLFALHVYQRGKLISAK